MRRGWSVSVKAAALVLAVAFAVWVELAPRGHSPSPIPAPEKQTGPATTDPAPASHTGYPPPPIKRIESSVPRPLTFRCAGGVLTLPFDTNWDAVSPHCAHKLLALISRAGAPEPYAGLANERCAAAVAACPEFRQ